MLELAIYGDGVHNFTDKLTCHMIWKGARSKIDTVNTRKQEILQYTHYIVREGHTFLTSCTSIYEDKISCYKESIQVILINISH